MSEALSTPLALAAGRRLRVALVTSSYNFIKDGVALTLNRLVEYLEGRGVEVLVFAPVAPAPAFAHAGTLVAVPSMAAPFRREYRVAPGLGRAARRRLEAFAPDIVHIAAPDFLGHDAQRWALGRGAPVVASYHTRYETYLKHYGLGLLSGTLSRTLRDFYGRCREVYAPSASMVEVLMAEGLGGNVRLWARGVDTHRFRPDRRSATWRAARGIAADALVVTFAGRLVREKQLGLLAEVFAGLERRGVPCQGLVVGDGPERATLERASPRAVFTGFLDGDELARAYAASDVFLFPSETETFGSVTLEAMASGVPTVCADATGSRSLVEPGVTSFLVEPGSAAAFVAAIGTLAADPALRRRMAAAARARSLRFSWDEAMAGLLGRYEALVAESRAAAA